MSKFNIGDKVRYIGKDHIEMPKFYPEIGTIGTVVNEGEDTDCYIQWPKGSTSKEDCWYCSNNDIELVKNEDMTNEEIWEMLKPKMEKNNVKSKASIINTHINDYPNNEVEIINAYYESDVINAIALAYRSGYLRAVKGLPFKIGGNKTRHSEPKKEKTGHWEPVDPDNLPKEGTKVKLKKEYCNYYGGVVESGEIGIVFHDASYVTMVLGYGINFGKYKTVFLPLDRNIIANCLDMWVEDDE